MRRVAGTKAKITAERPHEGKRAPVGAGAMWSGVGDEL